LFVFVIRARPDQALVLGAPRGGIITLIAVPVAFAAAALLYQYVKIAVATNPGAPAGRSVTEREVALLASNHYGW
jgi:hypothetical protein